MNIFYTQDENIQRLSKYIFGYTGRKFRIVVQDYYYLENYWSGGSKETPVLVCRDDLKYYHPSSETQNPFNAISHQEFQIPVNHFILAHSIYCGKDSGIIVYCREDEIDKSLKEEKDSTNELTIEEKVVLFCFRAYKSSYGGIKDYRKHEGMEFISSDKWDLAKSSLIEKGLINARNALTIEGKNAAVNLRDYEIKEELKQWKTQEKLN